MALNTPQNVWRGPVGQASADLESAGLASILLTTTMTAQRLASGKIINQQADKSIGSTRIFVSGQCVVRAKQKVMGKS